jgi:lipoprotein-anchoring transpeptidase ErfK/SrfK
MMGVMGRETWDQGVCHRLEHRWVIRRAALLLVFGLVLGACTSDGSEPVPAKHPIDVTSPSPVAQVDEKPPLLPEGADLVAVPSKRVIRIWKHPAQAQAQFKLDTLNPMGRFSPMLVDDAKRRSGHVWYEVLLPLRPNGSSGWVRGHIVTLKRIDQRIHVDLSKRLLSYYVHDELKQRFQVGVGTDATPTGIGSFYVWVKIRYASPYQPYGIAALGLSGFSPVLSEWPGGGRMAIHGTSSPSDLGNAVSHGCVRVYNADLKRILDIPLGTPVRITQ